MNPDQTNPPLAPIRSELATPQPRSVAGTAPGVESVPGKGVQLSTNPDVIKGGGFPKMLVVIGLVLLIIAGGGVWWYTQQSSGSPRETTPSANTAAPNRDQGVAGLKKELESLVVAEVEADFTAIDADLNSL